MVREAEAVTESGLKSKVLTEQSQPVCLFVRYLLTWIRSRLTQTRPRDLCVPDTNLYIQYVS